MNGLITAITTGTTAFAATNIDDLVILTLLFAQVNATFRHRQIIAGQYLGFTGLIIASLPGYLGRLIVPQTWVGLLGLVPIVIGLSRLLNQNQDADEVQAVSSSSERLDNRSVVSLCKSLLTPQTYNVAAITFANGGDNIGIYIPLFANSDFADLGVILGIFYLLVGVWCCIAYQLTQYSTIARFFSHYGNVFVPFVLIALGAFILIESGAYRLILPLTTML